MNRLKFVYFIPFVLMGLSGCATRSEVRYFMEQVESINKNQEKMALEIAKIDSLLVGQNEKLNEIRGIQSAYISSLETKLEELKSTMDESTGMFLEKVTPKAQESAAGKDSMSSEELYRNAYMDLTRGNYDLAQNGFMTFLLKFPESDLADNALYWLGECYYAQRDYAKALEQFIKLAKDYPKGDKVPSSMLKSGLAYQEMGKPNEALQMFQSLKKKYPDTREAQLAEEKVKELKKRR